MNEKRKNASLVLGIFGRYEEFEASLAQNISLLEECQYDIELIVVLDGSWWGGVPLIQTLKKRFRNAIISTIEEESHLPAVVFNHGASLATGKYLVFLWPTMKFSLINQETFNKYIPKDANGVFCK